jgi:23S rRNA G2445 N2-methylase RlmL
VCRTVRELGTPPSFSITANFVGKRNYSTDEIKHDVANGVEASHGWEYRERDAEADLNLRVFIEHERAYLGLRLAQSPLHERPYKIATIAGSLKPTVAAAMIRMGNFDAGATIVDPVCGAGTIPIEAVLSGLLAIGGDIHGDALEAARRNAAEAGVHVDWRAWDARSLPLQAASVDGIVANLPWGRQIEVDQDLKSFYVACIHEMARVVRPGGSIVVLSSLHALLAEAAPLASLVVETEREISLFGQTPTISILRGPR